MDPADKRVEAMKPNEAECCVCGVVMNRYFMERIATGRNVRYLCPECFEHGGKQADYVTKRMVYAKKKKRERQ